MPTPLFEKGNPGGPGRPPMSAHIVFPREMAKHGFDIGKEIAEALADKNWSYLKKLEKFLPYCFVQLKAREFDIKPPSPETSKLNAEQQIEAAKEFAAKSNEQPG